MPKSEDVLIFVYLFVVKCKFIHKYYINTFLRINFTQKLIFYAKIIFTPKNKIAQKKKVAFLQRQLSFSII